ncbi:hypothetical protein RN96_04755 [Fusobacterium polymorphum]|uniref:Uncharacterized protein n=1 Tax=Fusobacterium nucleatum subsp. polymorphum TaxID=76857 RepID=A0A2B7YN14_FUSNP|nr:hypothetical protein [Fusobacterium polymorphum]PGH22451.1 hypothetical protein RN96_04755 [Fusobacterium polymorphum]
MEDLYFKNEEARLIFGLAELGGKQQLDLLGIDYGHYSNKKLAKEWYTETKENLKDSTHPKLDKALEKLEILYKGMIGK